MAAPVFHPCQFGFDTVDIRRVGSVTSGGTSLSGIDDPIETDGGGYWRADFADGEAIERSESLAWRALTEGMDGGSSARTVLLCAERHFQPVLDRESGEPNSVIPDDAPDKGAAYTIGSAALRATTATFAGVSELPLEPGNLFSINHSRWGWRAYRIVSLSGMTATFRPPLRQAVVAGTPVEFDVPRCQMRLAAATSNPTSIGRFTQCAISFVEDMRKPPDA